MFTGIIRDLGTVFEIDATRPDTRMTIGTMLPRQAWSLGASVCCSGCCLTVVEQGDDWFSVDVSRETMNRTSLSLWRSGSRVNLEPSLRVGDELGGHFVTGHVDGVGHVQAIASEGGSHRLRVQADEAVVRYLAAKGSVSLDGVSLTVNQVAGMYFEMNIIPYTWAMTSLGMLREGDPVNVEIDMMARYVARMMGQT